jgi:hypothetical protein
MQSKSGQACEQVTNSALLCGLATQYCAATVSVQQVVMAAHLDRVDLSAHGEDSCCVHCCQ